MGYNSSFGGNTLNINRKVIIPFLQETHPKHPLVWEFENSKYQYGDSTELQLFSINTEFLPKLAEVIKLDDKNLASNEHKLKQHMNLLDSFKTKVPKTLKDFASVLYFFLKEHTFSYSLVSLADTPDYFRVISISYESYRSDIQEPAHVSITLSYTAFGNKKARSITVYTENLRKGSIEELLTSFGYRPMTKEDFSNYEERLVRYRTIVFQIGHQFTNDSTFSSYDELSYRMAKIRKGSKLVIDTPADFKLKRNIDSTAYFNQADHDEEALTFPCYDLCCVECFDLEAKRSVNVRSFNLKEYTWNDNILNDIVLPEDHRDCLNILMHSDSSDFDDVIRNKSNGIIVLCSGVPGTGKTLSAQCWAESLHKPLYVVQAAELGMDLNTIEKNLQKLFDRVGKWNAVLCLDEVDAFVHRRGQDLLQNAIVGIFLRAMESFSGILFMTTNRFKDYDGELFIDDAIVSRVSAHIVYKLPTKEAVARILNIQATKMNLLVENPEGATEFLFNMNCSGRDIRNFVKLSKMFLSSMNSDTITLASLKRVLPFHSTLSISQ